IRIADQDHIDGTDVWIGAVIFVIHPFLKIIPMIGGKFIAAYPIGRIAAWPRVVGAAADRFTGIENGIIPTGIDIFIRVIGILGALVSVLEKQVVNRLHHGAATYGCRGIAKAIIGISPHRILSIEDHLAGILPLVLEQAAVI